LIELLKAQFNLRMQHSTGQLEKTDEIRTVRRSIARVKTILTQKANA
jgi:large subunit ribosomal protein L29